MERTTESKSPLEATLADPLGDLARKERRNLLAVSVVAILITRVGLIPTQITALGITLTSSNKSALVVVIGAINIYYLIQFLIYGARDFFTWSFIARGAALHSASETLAAAKELKESLKSEFGVNDLDELRELLRKSGGTDDKRSHDYSQELEKITNSLMAWTPRPNLYINVKLLASAAFVFEFLLPIAVALYAIIAAFRAV